MDFSNMVLVLQVCPDCGQHADVLVVEGGTVIQKIMVISQEGARQVHDLLIQRGGVAQPQFLEAINKSMMVPTIANIGLYELLMLRSKSVPGSILRGEYVPGEDLSSGRFTLIQREDRKENGRVYLHLPDRLPRYVGQVASKADACEVLERWHLRGLPDQPEFEEQVRQAEWLAGPMFVKL